MAGAWGERGMSALVMVSALGAIQGLLFTGSRIYASLGRDHALFGKERHVPAQEAPVSGGYPMRAIRTDDHLYIRNFLPERWPVGTPDYRNAYIENAWLAEDAQVFIEHSANRSALELPVAFELYKQKQAGQVSYSLFRIRTDAFQSNG